MNQLLHICFAAPFLICSCQSTRLGNTRSIPNQGGENRISDEYGIENVVSYELFEWAVPQHCMAMVSLKSGTKLPMLCRQESASVYPIGQSVFSTEERKKFDIMCEPRFIDGEWSSFGLMEILVVTDSSGISDGKRRVARISQPLKLVQRP